MAHLTVEWSYQQLRALLFGVGLATHSYVIHLVNTKTKKVFFSYVWKIELPYSGKFSRGIKFRVFRE